MEIERSLCQYNSPNDFQTIYFSTYVVSYSAYSDKSILKKKKINKQSSKIQCLVPDIVDVDEIVNAVVVVEDMVVGVDVDVTVVEFVVVVVVLVFIVIVLVVDFVS